MTWLIQSAESGVRPCGQRRQSVAVGRGAPCPCTLARPRRHDTRETNAVFGERQGAEADSDRARQDRIAIARSRLDDEMGINGQEDEWARGVEARGAKRQSLLASTPAPTAAAAVAVPCSVLRTPFIMAV